MTPKMIVRSIFYICFLIVISTAFLNDGPLFKKEYGTIQYSDKDNLNVHFADLEDYCVKDGVIYVLYGNRGILKLYDIEGNYKIGFTYVTKYGYNRVFIIDDTVYVRDDQGGMYEFNKGEYQKYISRDQDRELDTFVRRTAISQAEQRTENGKYLYMRKGKMIYGNEEESVIIFKRPLYDRIYQYPWRSVVLAVLTLFMGLYVKYHGDIK